ncbi:MAG: PilZ domain-containing protein [Spirochaetaceae bacterium]|nr:MAG: PilZ domain-containing protein [Spirochaetaceae bacterium]
MKVVLVAERAGLRTLLSDHFTRLGASVIQYRHPIKAMDNLEEIAPDIIAWSAEDYPRHWKTFIAFLRSHVSREDSVFVLLTGPSFTHDDADKAQHLGVNGLVNENLDRPQELERLRNLVVRYKELSDLRRTKRLVPGPHDRVELMFSHPTSWEIVSGEVRDISIEGLGFVARRPKLVEGLESGDIIKTATLRIGEKLLSLQLRVYRNNEALSLLYHDLTALYAETIGLYLNDSLERELAAAESTD